MGKAYAAAGLFLTLCAVLSCTDWPYPLKALGCAVTGVFSIGARLTLAPAVGVLWVGLVLRANSRREGAVAAATIAGTSALAFLPFYLTDAENFMFWNLYYHLATTFDRRGWDAFREFVSLAPAVLCVSAGVLAWGAANLPKLRRSHPELLLAAVVGIVTQTVLKSSYGENATPFIPLAALGSVVMLARCNWSRPSWIKTCLALSPLLVLTCPLPPTQSRLSAAITQAAKLVRFHASPQSRVLTPLSIVALEADRRVAPRLEMGMFSLTTEMTEDEARRRHLVTPETLCRMVECGDAEVVVLDSLPTSQWNFHWTVPSLRPVEQRRMTPFYQCLRENYRPVFKNELFIVMARPR